MTQGHDDEAVSSYPNFAGKHQLSAYVNPEDTIRYARAHGDLDGYNPPDAIVMTYQRSVLEHLLRSEEFDAEEPPRGFRGLIHLPSTDHRIGVLGGFGFGASRYLLVRELHRSRYGAIHFCRDGRRP